MIMVRLGVNSRKSRSPAIEKTGGQSLNEYLRVIGKTYFKAIVGKDKRQFLDESCRSNRRPRK